MRKFIKFSLVASVLAGMGIVAMGEANAAVDTETAFVFNTFSFWCTACLSC